LALQLVLRDANRVGLREEIRVELHDELREGLCGFSTNRTHKTRKGTGMNLENVDIKIGARLFELYNRVGYIVTNKVTMNMVALPAQLITNPAYFYKLRIIN
jgi:hypothetical protein